VSETTEADQPVQSGPPRYAWLVESRLALYGTAVLLVAAGAACGFLLGRNFAASDLAAAKALNAQLTSQSQALKQEVTGQKAQLGAAQARLTGVEAKLEAIMPSENTYNVNPNQSLIVADGRLVIGLIGSPSNETVNIIINGKQQSAAAGDVISVAPNPTTSCRVTVQSFDMFKVLLNATCAGAKPQ